MILNHHGKPFDEDPPLMYEVGRSGVVWHSGYVDNEFHRDLRGPKAQRAYRQMAFNNPVIFLALLITYLYSRGSTINVEAGGDGERYERAVRLIESILEDVDGTIYGVIGRAVSSMIYGWGWFEKVWKICRGRNSGEAFSSKFDDGAIRLRKLAPRSQTSLSKWELRESDGKVMGIWQSAAPNYREVLIPRSKSIHIRPIDWDDNPEGLAILRGCYVPDHFQRHLQKGEAIGIYRNVAGFPYATLPPAYLQKNANANQKAIRTVVETAAKKIAIDELGSWVGPAEETPDGKKTGFGMRLIASSGKNMTEADIPIQRYRGEIGAVLNVGWALLSQGAQGRGSYALSSNLTSIHAMATAALITAALDQINEDVIPEALELNGIPAKYAPQAVLTELETPDLGVLGPYLSSLVSAGVIQPDDKLDEFARRAASAPVQDPGEPNTGALTEGMLDGSIDPETGKPPEPLVPTFDEDPADDTYFSIQQVASQLGVSPGKVRAMIRDRQLEGIQVGQRFRVSRTALRRALETMSTAGDDGGEADL